MKLFSLMVLLCASLGGYAQDIKGRVVEQENGKKVGLPGANVYWAGTTDGVVTDAEGHFKIKWNKSGRLVASFIGYRTDTLTVKRTDKQVEIELVAGEVLDEVKVVTRGNTTIMSTRGPLIEQVITGEELCKAACCNLGESFTTNASVDVAYADAVTGAKQIQLLGLTGKYVQMMTENMPNFRGISALYGLNYVPGPWMSAISVSKGAGSVINGYEAIAGQISVDYKKPATSEKIFVNAYGNSEGMIEFNANTGIRLNDKWSTAILAHGDWLTMEHDGNHDGFLDMPKTTQYNVMNRWQYKTDTWFLQFGGKLLDETRLGGQKGFRKEMRGSYGEGTLYGIGIDSRRYEGFLKLGYLMPQYENTSMAILVNYTDINQLNRKWWRRQCGVVMQEGVIFSESIGRNIAVDDAEIDEDRLMRAAEIACIKDYVMALPLKFNTKIGRDGVGLSQGQKQRILIARAVYKNPDYIFLDEATNSLDANNERNIVENLNKFYQGKTVVIVAHRLSTVKNADQIVVLNQGKVVEIGNHESLTAKRGAYYNLVKNQLELGN